MKKATLYVILVVFVISVAFAVAGCTKIFSKDDHKTVVINNAPSINDFVEYSKVTGYDQREIKFKDNAYSVKVLDGSTVKPVVMQDITLKGNRTISMRVLNQRVAIYDKNGNLMIESEIPTVL